MLAAFRSIGKRTEKKIHKNINTHTQTHTEIHTHTRTCTICKLYINYGQTKERMKQKSTTTTRTKQQNY